jgi:hypothetical protein
LRNSGGTVPNLRPGKRLNIKNSHKLRGVGPVVKRKNCPVCGTPIKLENLARHIKRVHPKEKIDLDYSDKERDELDRVKVRGKRHAGTSSKTWYGLAAVIIIVIVVAAAMMYLPSEEQPSTSPSAQVSGTYYDFGDVVGPTTLTHDFTISNVGDGVLEISRIATSCACTGATLTVGGDSNGPYRGNTPGSPSGWKEQIYPGNSGTLTVEFDTFYFGYEQTGDMEREVDVYTNDPSSPKITFTIRALVS